MGQGTSAPPEALFSFYSRFSHIGKRKYGTCIKTQGQSTLSCLSLSPLLASPEPGVQKALTAIVLGDCGYLASCLSGVVPFPLLRSQGSQAFWTLIGMGT